jgi:hypothetical protein
MVVYATEPRLVNFVTNSPPCPVGWNAPAVVGKSVEPVEPTMYALPSGAIAMPWATSLSLPPIYVDQRMSDPDAFNFVTKASDDPLSDVVTPLLVGKSVDVVAPTMTAFPPLSTAMDVPWSTADPPRYVA